MYQIAHCLGVHEITLSKNLASAIKQIKEKLKVDRGVLDCSAHKAYYAVYSGFCARTINVPYKQYIYIYIV